MALSSVLSVSAANAESVEKLRHLYKAPQQIEFLYLEAEAETLIRQLELLKGSQTSDRN